MSHFSKKTIAALAIASLVAGPAFAEEATGEKSNNFTGFFRKLFNYPGKAVQSTADTTGHALSNTGEKVLSKTGENIAEGRPVEALAQPVIGSVETTGQAGAEVARVPVTAAEESGKVAEEQAASEQHAA